MSEWKRFWLTLALATVGTALAICFGAWVSVPDRLLWSAIVVIGAVVVTLYTVGMYVASEHERARHEE